VRGTEPSNTTLLRRSDPRYPCDSVGAAHQPSCWKYQPVIAYTFTGDIARVVRLCAESPPASTASCFHGVGKQAVGGATDAREVVQTCARAVAPSRVDACLAGAAESYIDDSWTADGAMTLCRAAPEANKRACYAAVGARMALIRTSAALVARDCAAAEERYVAACRNGDATG